MRRIRMSVCAGVLAFATAGVAPQGAAAQTSDDPVVPLLRAHAHNDYEHDRPLLDALDHGFTSVEADVWLVGGQLLVAHDREDVDPARTLRSLYLRPLARRIEANGGSVHAIDTDFQLMVDIKSAGASTYRALHRELRRYRHYLTTYGEWGTNERAFQVTVSGNRPRAYMERQTVRYAAYDGRSPDIGTDVLPDFMPLVSDSWERQFTWRGTGAIPGAERERLRGWATQAAENGQRLRLWATPDAAGPARDAVWRELLAAGVGYINTDDLAGLQEFLLEHDPWAHELADEIDQDDDRGKARPRAGAISQ